MRKFTSEITLISFIFALLMWFGIKLDSFKSVIFEKTSDWVLRIAIIIIFVWTIYITIKIRKLLKTNIISIDDPRWIALEIV